VLQTGRYPHALPQTENLQSQFKWSNVRKANFWLYCSCVESKSIAVAGPTAAATGNRSTPPTVGLSSQHPLATDKVNSTGIYSNLLSPVTTDGWLNC